MLRKYWITPRESIFEKYLEETKVLRTSVRILVLWTHEIFTVDTCMQGAPIIKERKLLFRHKDSFFPLIIDVIGPAYVHLDYPWETNLTAYVRGSQLKSEQR